jgi:hypothetical protein
VNFFCLKSAFLFKSLKEPANREFYNVDDVLKTLKSIQEPTAKFLPNLRPFQSFIRDQERFAGLQAKLEKNRAILEHLGSFDLNGKLIIGDYVQFVKFVKRETTVASKPLYGWIYQTF